MAWQNFCRKRIWLLLKHYSRLFLRNTTILFSRNPSLSQQTVLHRFSPCTLDKIVPNLGMENRKQFSVRSIKHIGGENSNIFKTNQNIKIKLFGGARISRGVRKFSVFSKKNEHFFHFR